MLCTDEAIPPTGLTRTKEGSVYMTVSVKLEENNWN